MTTFYFSPEDDEPQGEDFVSLALATEPEEPLWLALTHDEALDLYIKLGLDDEFAAIRDRLWLLMKLGPNLRLVDDDFN